MKLIFGLCGIVLMFWWIRNSKQGGSVLLDLGRNRLQRNLLNFILAVCLLIAFSQEWVEVFESFGETGIYEVFSALTWLPLVVILFLSGLTHDKIRERGIFYVYFIKWERIASYEWQGLILMLRIEHPLSFLRTYLINLPIPDQHRGTVENLLAQYVQADENSNTYLNRMKSVLILLCS